MAQMALSCLFLFHILFFSCPVISSSSFSSPSTQAQRLIRSFNLFPTSDVNSGTGRPPSTQLPGAESSLVEKQFRFPVLGDPGTPSVQDLGHHAGYYRLPHSKDARMFYFFFESRQNKSNAPVVIWLTGGPGCSSEIALFYENGPFHIANNMSLLWNDYGWDQVSNLIYVDQPTGTGFSYTSDNSDIRHDENGVSNDLYDFLQAFFKQHPHYLKNDFYITGESYAGHYIPAFASRVHKGNKNKDGAIINLKGFAIGNGLTDPATQYKAYPDYALNASLITQSQYEDLSSMIPDCEKGVAECNLNGGESCIEAHTTCNFIFDGILGYAGDVNVRKNLCYTFYLINFVILYWWCMQYYDTRKQCVGRLCYDFSNMESLLTKTSVRKALGVGDIDFVSCSSVVYDAMITDWMKNLEVGIPSLLEDGIKVLIYAGEYDIICNWLGNSRWVHAMKWSGQKEFTAAAMVPYTVDGVVKGQLKEHGPLIFLKVHDAGHMVPMDQPKAALQMLKRWTQGSLLIPGEDEGRIVLQ